MARLIVFDVDSTLIQVESLDYAARAVLSSAPDGETRLARLSALTDQGMEGALDFRTSLEERLALVGFSRSEITDAAGALRQEVTPGMTELLDDLRRRGVGVAAVSGGFLDLVGGVLMDLGFEANAVRANTFTFAGERVTGFDRSNPLSRSGGQAEAIKRLKLAHDAEAAVMVGDGMTDFEAFEAGAADAFIGFGAIKRRDAVAAKAPAYADDVATLRRFLLR
jgi:phosphoserine phosphatase SerB